MGLWRDEIQANQEAMQYGFATGKVAVLRTRLLERPFLERLAEARDFNEQKRLLADTQYGKYMETAHSSQDVERLLDEVLDESYEFLVRATLPPAVVRFFRLPYDYANLKAAAKAYVLSAPVAGLLQRHGTIPVQRFEGPIGRLPGMLGETAGHLPTGSEQTPEDVDMRLVDTVVDRGMFAELLATAEESGSEFLVDYTRLSIDLANVRTVVRARRAQVSPKMVPLLLFEGGSIAAPKVAALASMNDAELAAAVSRLPGMRALADAAFELPGILDSALDAVRCAVLRRGVLGKIGPEPVISYVLAREAEIAALRLVLLGKLSDIDSETLRRHVRTVG